MMKILVLVTISFILLMCDTVWGEHPSLLFTSGEISGLKAKAGLAEKDGCNVSLKEAWDKIVKIARTSLNTRETDGIFEMGLMYAVTRGDLDLDSFDGRGRLFSDVLRDKLIEELDTFLLYASWEGEGWGAVAANTYRVAFIYDLLYSELPPSYHQAVPKALVQKGIKPLAKQSSPCISNGFFVYVSGYGIGALVLLDDPVYGKNAQAWLNDAKKKLKGVLDIIDPDGGYPEGLGYGTVGFDAISSVSGEAGSGTIHFIHALEKVTGDDSLLRHSYMKNLMYFSLYTLIPDGKGGVGFCDTWQWVGFPLTVSRIAGEWKDSYGMWYLKQIGYQPRNAIEFLFYDPLVKPETPDLPPSKLFRGVRWAIMRSAWWDKEGMLFAIHWDKRHYHEHNDQAHFELHAYNTCLATSPGYAHGRWFRGGTYGHNSILVHGGGNPPYSPGQDCCVKGGYGKVDEFLGSSCFDYVRGSAPDAYTPDLERFDRSVVFARPDYFIIFDDLRDEEPHIYSWLLQVTRAHCIRQEGKYEINDKEKIILSIPTGCSRRKELPGQLYVKSILPHDSLIESKIWDEKAYDEKYGPYLEISTKEKNKGAFFLHLLYPMRKEWSLPVTKEFELTGGKGIDIKVPSGRNIHVYRVEDGEVTDSDWKLNGENCMISLSDDGSWIAYALCGGAGMEYKGASFLSASSPVTGAFSRWKEYELREGKPRKIISSNEIYGIIQLKSSQEVRFYVGDEVSKLKLNDMWTKEYKYKEGTVTIKLPEGESRLLVELAK